MQGFLTALAEQRWDDHRYYHHSRVNQSLHLLSALTFLTTYVLLFVQPVTAALVGWLLAMLSRQAGHFFFEPKDYDDVNQATHQHKEAIKVGYNLHRKIVLLSVWALSTLGLLLDPTLFGLFEAPQGTGGLLRNLSYLWLAIAAGALVFRVAQLAVLQDLQTGLVWLAKILTDPFHDVKMYHKAPLQLLRGEWLDPMADVRDRAAAS